VLFRLPRYNKPGMQDKEQSKTIQELQSELVEHDAIDLKLQQMITRQSEQTQQLFSLLQNKDVIDSKQDDIIKNIQALMTNYDAKLNNSTKQIEKLNSEISGLAFELTDTKKRGLIFSFALSIPLICVLVYIVTKL
jgi:chromosome segregation ATPase